MTGLILSIDLSALRANYRLLRDRHAKKNCAAVVKANAYGLGMGPCAQALWQEGCREFFTATLDEAIVVRQILPQASIAVFSGIFSAEGEIYAEHRLTAIANDLSQIEYLTGELRSIIHVDTGMTRLGLSESDLKKASSLMTHQPLLIISHLACANEPNDPKNAEQLARFKTALSYFPDVHASFANSSGHFLPAAFHFDIGRPGCALYGINPVEGMNPMHHVATLSAPVIQIRTLDRDETVGYSATYPLQKNARVAIAALGYADGMLRSLSNKGFAWIAGERVPFAGRVSMDLIALDVSSVPEAKLAGECRAEFINEKQTVSDVAHAAGTIGYELFTRIGDRVKRVYTGQ